MSWHIEEKTYLSCYGGTYGIYEVGISQLLASIDNVN